MFREIQYWDEVSSDMRYKQWNTLPHKSDGDQALQEQGVPSLVAAVLCARGLETLEQATQFLSWHPKLLCDPYLMQDMDKATERIQRAIDEDEKIAVYGDYDVDGITATCLLTDYLRPCGAPTDYYLPSRCADVAGPLLVSRFALRARVCL